MFVNSTYMKCKTVVNRIPVVLLCLSFIAFALSGCGRFSSDALKETLKEIIPSEEATESLIPNISESNGTNEGETPIPEKKPSATVQRVFREDPEQKGRYYYELCSEEEKQVYQEIYEILAGHEENVTVSATDKDLLNRLNNWVQNDHPELFYVEGWKYTTYKVGEEITSVEFSGCYTYEAEETAPLQKRVDEIVDTWLETVADWDDYEVVKSAYEFIVFHTDYVPDVPDNQNYLSVFLHGQSVCKGYAKAFHYMMNRAGIPCALVTGVDNMSGSHAWNIVRVNGAWYQIDVTWGDPSYNENEDGNVAQIIYDFLNVTTSDMESTHIADAECPLPECNSVADSYYVREGLYLDGFSEEQVKEVFRSCNEKGMTNVSLKASDAKTYDDLVEYLIMKQNIFKLFGEYKDGVNSLRCSQNEQRRTLLFLIPNP